MVSVFDDKSERNRLFSMIGSLTPDKITADATAFFDYLAARPEVAGETASASAATAWVGESRDDRRSPAGPRRGRGVLPRRRPGDRYPDSPHLLADRMTATVYVGGAENDASFTDGRTPSSWRKR